MDCSKSRRAWTANEDVALMEYVEAHGSSHWPSIPKNAGLKRSGKSCRLRWVNHLRPDIKRGSISEDEEQLIIRLHSLLGNRWELIAGRLPGRTGNEIKNYWNRFLKKKFAMEKRNERSDPIWNESKLEEEKIDELCINYNHNCKDDDNANSNIPSEQFPGIHGKIVCAENLCNMPEGSSDDGVNNIIMEYNGWESALSPL